MTSQTHDDHHRYHDPKTGRYLAPDPIGLAGGINPYLYAEEDPVNLVDSQALHGLFLFGRPPLFFRPAPSWRPPIAKAFPVPRMKVEPRLRPAFEDPPGIIPRPTPEKMPWWYWAPRLLSRTEVYADKCESTDSGLIPSYDIE